MRRLAKPMILGLVIMLQPDYWRSAYATDIVAMTGERFNKLAEIANKIQAELRRSIPGQSSRVDGLLDDFDIERALVLEEGKTYAFDKECPLRVFNENKDFFSISVIYYEITCNPVYSLTVALTPRSSFKKTSMPGEKDETLTDEAFLKELSKFEKGRVFRAKVKILVDPYKKTRPHERSYIHKGDIRVMPREPRIKILELRSN